MQPIRDAFEEALRSCCLEQIDRLTRESQEGRPCSMFAQYSTKSKICIDLIASASANAGYFQLFRCWSALGVAVYYDIVGD